MRQHHIEIHRRLDAISNIQHFPYASPVGGKLLPIPPFVNGGIVNDFGAANAGNPNPRRLSAAFAGNGLGGSLLARRTVSARR